MPYISTQLSIELTKEKETALKIKLGKAIELLPGKTEDWLMLNFDDKCRMYFKGEYIEPMAFVEVKLFGKSSAQSYSAMTSAVTKAIYEELGIAPEQIYVKYEECSVWGWNGKNF